MRRGLCRAALLKAFVSTSFVDSDFQGIEMAVLKIFSEGLSLVWKIFIGHQIILSSFKRERKGKKCWRERIKEEDSKRKVEWMWKGEGGKEFFLEFFKHAL